MLTHLFLSKLLNFTKSSRVVFALIFAMFSTASIISKFPEDRQMVVAARVAQLNKETDPKQNKPSQIADASSIKDRLVFGPPITDDEAISFVDHRIVFGPPITDSEIDAFLKHRIVFGPPITDEMMKILLALRESSNRK